MVTKTEREIISVYYRAHEQRLSRKRGARRRGALDRGGGEPLRKPFFALSDTEEEEEEEEGDREAVKSYLRVVGVKGERGAYL